MFGLFKKKEKKLIIHDKILQTEEAKFKQCAEINQTNPNSILVAWFEETRDNLRNYLKKNNHSTEVFLACDLSLNQHDKEFIFVEHHPMQSEEQNIAKKFNKEEIIVLSSLSEPIFKLFGSDKMIPLLQKMGTKEDEVIEHTMISNSIRKAQEKISSKKTSNHPARSQQEWFSNFGDFKI